MQLTSVPAEAELRRLYHEGGLSLREIARVYDVNHTTVLKWMNRYGIDRRRRAEANRLNVRNSRVPEGDRWSKRCPVEDAPWLWKSKYVVFGDLHSPFHDARAVDILCQVIEDHPPDVIIENGDGLDFYQFSKFDRSPLDGHMLEEERRAHTGVARAIRDAAGDSPWYIYLGGPDDNHLYRLIRFIHANPGLAGYHALEPEYVLDVGQYGAEYVEGPVWLHGSTVICHARRVGTRNSCSNFSAYTARKLADTFRCSGITAHTHRLGYYAYNCGTPTTEEVHFLEGGCLCQLDPVYMPSPNWQQGFVYVQFLGDQPFFEIVSIRNGRTIFRGKEYGA